VGARERGSGVYYIMSTEPGDVLAKEKILHSPAIIRG